MFSIVTSGLDTFTKQTEEQWEIAKNTKEKESVLVNGFLPLDEGNLDTLKNDLVKSLTNTPSTQATPSATVLFETVLTKDVWQEAWKVFIKKSEENINEATLELINHIKIELKNKVVEELQKSATDGSSLLPSLKNLIIRASRAGTTSVSNQVKLLQSEL